MDFSNDNSKSNSGIRLPDIKEDKNGVVVFKEDFRLNAKLTKSPEPVNN